MGDVPADAVAAHHLDRHRSLVRVHADDDPLCLFYRAPPMLDAVVERGGQRYFELNKPLLSLSLLLVAMPGLRRPDESHTRRRGQPM